MSGSFLLAVLLVKSLNRFSVFVSNRLLITGQKATNNRLRHASSRANLSLRLAGINESSEHLFKHAITLYEFVLHCNANSYSTMKIRNRIIQP